MSNTMNITLQKTSISNYAMLCQIPELLVATSLSLLLLLRFSLSLLSNSPSSFSLIFMSLSVQQDLFRTQVRTEQNVSGCKRVQALRCFTTLVVLFFYFNCYVLVKCLQVEGASSLADALSNVINMLSQMARHLPALGSRQHAVCKCKAEFCASPDQFPGDSQ
jgi:hypothetical protein